MSFSSSLSLPLELSSIFGFDSSGAICPAHVDKFLQASYSGYMSSPGLRALCWRFLLGIFPKDSIATWPAILHESVVKYEKLKKKLILSIDEVSNDPLMENLNDPYQSSSILYDPVTQREQALKDLKATKSKLSSSDSGTSSSISSPNDSAEVSESEDHENDNEDAGIESEDILDPHIFERTEGCQSDKIGDNRVSSSWSRFYQQRDLSNFIKGDLDRLYLNGVEEEYFQTPLRRNQLLSILLVWSTHHPDISYRQGMHEIAGHILYIVEEEREKWSRAKIDGQFDSSYPFYSSFSSQNLEAYVYQIFKRIMIELDVLYDPLPINNHADSSQPFIIQFCTKIQEHYLRLLDPHLCYYLENYFIQAQLYGLKWSRLLFGREFPVKNLFYIWDYIFATCFEIENEQVEEPAPPISLDGTVKKKPINIYSLIEAVRILKGRSTSNIGKRIKKKKVSYELTPLLGGIGDVMLAMLLLIRDEIMQESEEKFLILLMNYPTSIETINILQMVNKIRKGLIVRQKVFEGVPIASPSASSSNQISTKTASTPKKKMGLSMNKFKSWNLGSNQSHSAASSPSSSSISYHEVLEKEKDKDDFKSPKSRSIFSNNWFNKSNKKHSTGSNGSNNSNSLDLHSTESICPSVSSDPTSRHSLHLSVSSDPQNFSCICSICKESFSENNDKNQLKVMKVSDRLLELSQKLSAKSTISLITSTPSTLFTDSDTESSKNLTEEVDMKSLALELKILAEILNGNIKYSDYEEKFSNSDSTSIVNNSKELSDFLGSRSTAPSPSVSSSTSNSNN